MAALYRMFVLRSEENAKALYAFLKANWNAQAIAGKPLAIIISEHKATRSSQQNKRYWAMLNEIAVSAWINGKQYSVEAWHEHFKRKMIGCEELPDGTMVGISTTTLSVAEFNDYMNKIEGFAIAELGIEFL
jgi:hypothetical protein